MRIGPQTKVWPPIVEGQLINSYSSSSLWTWLVELHFDGADFCFYRLSADYINMLVGGASMSLKGHETPCFSTG